MPKDLGVLIHPIISEKSVRLQEGNKYVFRVDKRATKNQIKDAVEDAFGVTVVKVSTVNMKSKRKRLGRYEGRTASWKKAIVSLKAGEKIKGLDIT
ncbi:MAG: large subunit ribosomal protein [Candidatus Atribacteria bacterium]|nr:large subunit ribosomal protein [Candidatus Atribacteria bacterium]